MFYLIYNYYLVIYYKIKNNFIEEKILLIYTCVKQFYNLREVVAKYLKNVATQFTKYYNREYNYICQELCYWRINYALN